jgi:hypothetical protein
MPERCMAAAVYISVPIKLQEFREAGKNLGVA